jgi:hypothetical protein
MRSLLLLVLAAAVFGVAPLSVRGGPMLGAALPIVLCVALAVVVSGQVSGVAVALGAVAAFVGTFAWAMAPALGGAITLALVYAERSLRIRTLRAIGAHVGLALLAGAAAGLLAASFSASPLASHAVAVTMCAVLAMLPLVIEADDRRVLLLEAAAATLGAPLASTLLEGAALLRHDETLDRETAAKIKKTWLSLERLIEARLRLEGKARSKGDTAVLVREMLDRQIIEHVTSLSRARAAAATATAAEVGIDDQAVRDVHARGEALDERSRAMVEMGDTP